MITIRNMVMAAGALALCGATLGAQQGEQSSQTLEGARKNFEQRLESAMQELAELRAKIGDEQLELAREVTALEMTLSNKRAEGRQVASELADKTQDLANRRSVESDLKKQKSFMETLLIDLRQGFGSRLHVAELQLYKAPVDAAALVMEDNTATDEAKLVAHLDVVETAFERLEQAIGGQRFEGHALASGVRKPGKFVVLGPTALFQSNDSEDIGLVRELRDTNEPDVVAFSAKEDREAASQLALGMGGAFPVDVTLGDAQKIEGIEESWWEHVQKGGVIMIPMAVLAGLALLVVVIKWLSMLFVRRPSKRQVNRLLDYLDGSDYASATEYATTLPGPGGRMLAAGAQNLGKPRELIEEVMYEKMLTSKLKLHGWLPFVAICATSAPLLGLLGTVTGIMGTFALMTEFGTGDPKVLSSGISEALITTEHGLIIAIPSLLLHAFLFRKAKGLVDGMEKMALQFTNRVHTAKPVVANGLEGVVGESGARESAATVA
ncbi:MAG: MotA/TolQ/ExbB proton channel family protein [Planctomycetota bacterium]